MKERNFVVKIAEPEKALLDSFYIKKMNTLEEVEEMRFNEIVTKEIVSFDKLVKYQRIFNSKQQIKEYECLFR